MRYLGFVYRKDTDKLVLIIDIKVSMKKCLFLMLMLISVSVMGQETPLQCDTVIQAQGKSATEIYTTVRSGVATPFNSAQDVIQMDDPENGILVCKGNFSYKAPGGALTYGVLDGWVNFTLQVQVRDGRFKVTMGQFAHEAKRVPGGSYDWSLGLITDRERAKAKGAVDFRQKKTWKDLKVKCKVQFMEVVMALSQAAEQGSGLLDTDDDW